MKKEYERTQNPQLLVMTVNLANSYRDQGKWSEAMDLYKDTLEHMMRLGTQDHEHAHRTAYNLGVLYKNLHKTALAKNIFQWILQRRKSRCAQEDILTLNTINSMATMCADQGKLDDAEKMYLQSLLGYENLFGSEHDSTTCTYKSLGDLHRKRGNLKDAEKWYLRALQGHARTRGRDDMPTLVLLGQLSALYLEHGKLERAEETGRQALGGLTKFHGHQHRAAIRTLCLLGDILMARNQVEEAHKMYQQALEIPQEPGAKDELTRLIDRQMSRLHLG